MRSQKIENIRKRFPNEWLLIEVDKTDKQRDVSLSGYVIAHSPQRDVIYKKLMAVKSKRPILVEHPSHRLPKNMAVVFSIRG